MPRFILIDNASGYIFADTADFQGRIAVAQRESLTAIDAAREFDEMLNEYGLEYTEVPRRELASNERGYHVYRADVRGSDAVPTVEDGQDQATIDAVEVDCEYVTSIRCTEVG